MSLRSLAILLVLAVAVAGGVVALKPALANEASPAAVSGGDLPTAKPPAEDGQTVDPLKLIEGTTAMSPLAPDKPLRLAVQGTFPKPKRGEQVRFFFASHAHYTGPITRQAVDKLVESGRADTLEYRLKPAELESLRASLTDFDQALRDVAILIADTEDRIKAAVRTRPELCLVAPRPNDAREDASEENSRMADHLRERVGLAPGAGTIWAEPCEDGQRLMAIRWSDWPDLKAMYDDRSHMLVERSRRCGDWIRARVGERGISVFGPGDDDK